VKHYYPVWPNVYSAQMQKITIKRYCEKQSYKLPAAFDHQTALSVLVEQLQQINLVKDISAIGHRVVHGGEHYSQPTLITIEVEQSISQLAKLAPLHNPAHLIVIKACYKAVSRYSAT